MDASLLDVLVEGWLLVSLFECSVTWQDLGVSKVSVHTPDSVHRNWLSRYPIEVFLLNLYGWIDFRRELDRFHLKERSLRIEYLVAGVLNTTVQFIRGFIGCLLQNGLVVQRINWKLAKFLPWFYLIRIKRFVRLVITIVALLCFFDFRGVKLLMPWLLNFLLESLNLLKDQ